MLLRSLAAAAVGLGLGFAIPAAANAYPAFTTGAVNLRAGPGVGYARITSLPAGAGVDVHFCQPGWCQVGTWAGTGWVSANYLSVGARYDRRYYMRQQPGLYFRFNLGPGPKPGPWPGPGPWPWWW